MKKRIFNCETILTHDSVPDLIRQLQIQGLTNIGLTARRHTLITPTQRGPKDGILSFPQVII
jgi:hypothetical protein